ncbi:putative glycolipid-binding domain-containing protein [Microbacterium sp. VKM Ac-2923]|uniref:putative glycolipid-binding domain-containing protein n=1 Tax=Microbacterium sp. VKM Ac-2923 TaxID=2929476 RepID=UPI001FB2694C|nr:putative glycolipid-binding domain-containing protein [Microbacterium sp. VKM Ac-2923]MCJ1708068.1 putative glycolipid-binding domain-containing protein [Microbacterium sp. VKM Ac-2923]
MNRLAPLPASAGWRHHGTRTGFEVVFFVPTLDGHRLAGRTTADDGASMWSIDYAVIVDSAWRTREARAAALTVSGEKQVTVSRDDGGGWRVDGRSRPELHGCVDIDFESSAMTNTLPLRRREMVAGVPIDVPAAFVRAPDLRVERLEQRYTLIEAAPERVVFHYESSTFGFACDLLYDAAGLVTEYPGIATRHS